ncbi:hypothetical protein AX14_004626 [Amanita brunnescens Koide BX004]|nr:hypothetical protein AX14_004626 [Amanita brunnescens Koide BX004]
MSCSHLRFSRRLLVRSGFLSHTQTRSVRTKHGSGKLEASIKRDERLLKRLETQLASIQDKIKKDEEEGEKLLQKYKKHSTFGGSKGFEDHNEYFWEKVLTRDDRRLLESHGIRSLNELASVHDTVQSKLSQPPHPKIEELDAKSRCALEIYQSIPIRLNDTARSKAGSWLGGWF